MQTSPPPLKEAVTSSTCRDCVSAAITVPPSDNLCHASLCFSLGLPVSHFSGDRDPWLLFIPVAQYVVVVVVVVVLDVVVGTAVTK